jgi:glycosyltransferase involved in cell wall biosynthesis
MRPLDRRLELLTDEVKLAQGMAARAYEAAQRGPETLERVRAAPDYEVAFQPDPLVTVRIATYNRAEVLCERTLPSVLRQTYANWEAIVVGDACTDDTEERIRALGDERIRFINLPFRGPYPDDDRTRWRVIGVNPMNTGMRLARGQWIAPLDDDDEFDADHIEVLLAHAQATHAELANGQLRVLDTQTGAVAHAELCSWPPEDGRFNFLASLMHTGLRAFEYDANSHLAGEVSDWNLARRLWQAGARFSFLDRAVGTYYLRPRSWHSDG